jgi:hypothetical protein
LSVKERKERTKEADENEGDGQQRGRGMKNRGKEKEGKMTKEKEQEKRKKGIRNGRRGAKDKEGDDGKNVRRKEGVGTTHINSGAGQSQSRNHQVLSNGSVNTFPRRYNFCINNPLLGKTYNNT